MRKNYKKKKRSCKLCKPHKMKMERRWSPKELSLLKEFEYNRIKLIGEN